MKKTVLLLLSLIVAISLCSCTDKDKREREIKQQKIDQAQENLRKIDEVQKQQDNVKDLLDQYNS